MVSFAVHRPILRRLPAAHCACRDFRLGLTKRSSEQSHTDCDSNTRSDFAIKTGLIELVFTIMTTIDTWYDPSRFLETRTVTLENLLSSDRTLDIPSYQRDYSWTIDQVASLVHDMVSLYRRSYHGGKRLQTPKPHFFGPIVLELSDSKQTHQCDVIDGQQRLVTLCLLLRALSARLQPYAAESPYANYLQLIETCLVRVTRNGPEPRMRIALHGEHYKWLIATPRKDADIDAYIASYYQCLGKKPNRRRPQPIDRLWGAYRLAAQEIDLLTKQIAGNPGRIISEFADTVLCLAVFLQMTVRQNNVAYEVFETLNARGLELTQGDLVKNKVFATAGDKLETVQQHWASMADNLRDERLVSITEFLHIHFVALHSDIKASELYDHVSKGLLDGTLQADSYAGSLAFVANGFLELANSENDDLRELIRTVRTDFPNRYSLCVILAAIHRFKSANSVEVHEALRIARDFAVRAFMVQEMSLESYKAACSAAAIELSRSADGASATDACISKLRESSSDQDFEHRFGQLSAANSKLGYYYIRCIEDHLAKGAGYKLHPQSHTQHLEHIMPQTPSPEWKDAIGDYDEPTYKDYISRIGNFVALERDKNSQAKNKSISEKQAIYAKSQLRMPRQISEFLVDGKWTYDSINKRQFALAKLAVKVWRL
jgi:Protein of unknown function DUF262/Protein of unknown function (DUF1524)